MLKALFTAVSKPVIATGLALSLMASTAFGATNTGEFKFVDLTTVNGQNVPAATVHEWVKNQCPDTKTKELTCSNKAVHVVYGGHTELAEAFKETLEKYSDDNNKDIILIRANDNNGDKQDSVLMSYVNGVPVYNIKMSSKYGELDRSFAYNKTSEDRTKSVLEELKLNTDSLFKKHLP